MTELQGIAALSLAAFVASWIGWAHARIDKLRLKVDAMGTEVSRLRAIAEQHDGWISRREGPR